MTFADDPKATETVASAGASYSFKDAPPLAWSWPGYGKRPTSHLRKPRHCVPTEGLLRPVESDVPEGGGGSPEVVLVKAAARIDELALVHRVAPSLVERLWAFMSLVLFENHRASDDHRAFISLPQRLISRALGNEHARYAAPKLIDWGLIECDGKSKAGEKALGYRFTESCLSLPAENRQLSTRFTATRRRERARTSAAVGHGRPVARDIYWSLQQLTIDPLAKLEQPDPADPKWTFKRAKENRKRQREGLPPKTGDHRHEVWAQRIMAVEQKCFSLEEGKEGKRIFHTFANFPKRLRPLARLGGQPTVEVDISNSQPFFMLCLYPSQSVERARFGEVVSSGKFYEHMSVLAGRGTNSITREKLKNDAYTLFFARYSGMRRGSKLWRGLEAGFPELAAIIDQYKGNRLPVRLQSIEARAIIDGALPALYKAHPGVPFLPIHDSIVAPRAYADQVRTAIEDHCLAVTGFRPHTKLTHSALVN